MKLPEGGLGLANSMGGGMGSRWKADRPGHMAARRMQSVNEDAFLFKFEVQRQGNDIAVRSLSLLY